MVASNIDKKKKHPVFLPRTSLIFFPHIMFLIHVNDLGCLALDLNLASMVIPFYVQMTASVSVL